MILQTACYSYLQDQSVNFDTTPPDDDGYFHVTWYVCMVYLGIPRM